MSRAIILVLDSLGIGASADAADFGDLQADTFGHIVQACAAGQADNASRQGLLRIPNLTRWGLPAAATDSRTYVKTVDKDEAFPLASSCYDMTPQGAYGFAEEISVGKDTPSGHWEICGVPVLDAWGMFDKPVDSFPKDLLAKICQQAQVGGTLANSHASGTEVIKQYGIEHMRTGWPICYTSADSVFQIAAHEGTFGLQRLYQLCDMVRPLMDELNVGRVIARPFVGDSPANFKRTANRKDLTTPPMQATLLDRLQSAGITVTSIGKIADIFAHQGIDIKIKGTGNMDLMDKLYAQMAQQNDGLLFVNLVDFDSVYGHRRDVAGYAQALEDFDARMPELEALLQEDDIVLLTADHGCDPTMPGSDHTREHVPVVFFGDKIKRQALGKRDTFADMGQTLATHFGISPLTIGTDCAIH